MTLPVLSDTLQVATSKSLFLLILPYPPLIDIGSVARTHQLTGVNFVFYYGTTFFKNSGISDPFLISIATNVVNVFMTLPGMWGVERFGRRRLLIIGAIGMCVCEYIVAIVGVTVSVHNIAGQKVLIAFVCIYIVCGMFHFSWLS